MDSLLKGFRGIEGDPGKPGTFGRPGLSGNTGDKGDSISPEDAWQFKGANGDSGFPGNPGRDVYAEINNSEVFPGPKGAPGDAGMHGIPGRSGTKGAYGDRVINILVVPPMPQQIQISVDQPYAGQAARCCGISGTHSTYI
jgi:hypothetical protein